MRKLTSNATYGLVVLLSCVWLLVIIVALLGYGFSRLERQPAATPKAPLVAATWSHVPIESSPAVEAPALAAEPDQVATRAATTTSTTKTSSTNVQTPPNVFAADMDAAGIAATDQPIVQTLLFDGPVWKSIGPMGVHVASQGSSAVERFERVTSYVASRYGSWQAALTQSQNNGGNW